MAVDFTPTITLDYDSGNTVTLSSPGPDYEFEPKMEQAVGQTAAGAWYVYDKAVENRTLVLTLRITDAEKLALETWVRDQAKTSVNTFTLINHKRKTHTGCRLTAPVAYRRTPGGRWSITLRIATTNDVE